MIRTNPKIHVLAHSAGALFTNAALAADEYAFTLVDAFITDYNLRECYIYDLNEHDLLMVIANWS